MFYSFFLLFSLWLIIILLSLVKLCLFFFLSRMCKRSFNLVADQFINGNQELNPIRGSGLLYPDCPWTASMANHVKSL